MPEKYSSSAHATSRTRGVVLACWAILTAAMLAYVLLMGWDAPYADEWEFIPALTGGKSLLPWLWEQHNEHRLPLPRALYLGLFHLTHDFRTGMVVQVGLLSGLCLYLTHLAAQLRGRPHWADVFFPLSLLHVGHWENLMMGYQLCFALFTVLTVLLGVEALKAQPGSEFRTGIRAAVLCLLLALCGGFGLAIALPVTGWLIVLAVRAGGWRGLVLGVLAMLPWVYALFYFDGYLTPHHHPTPGSGGLAMALVSGQTLAMSFGIGVSGVWWLVAGGLEVIGVVTLLTMVRWRNVPAEVGLTAVGIGIVGLATAIGLGRGVMGDDMGLCSRYSLLTWPLPGLVYLIWVKQGGKLGEWLQLVLCATAMAAFIPNTITGIVVGRSLQPFFIGLREGAQHGESPYVTVNRFANTPHSGQVQRAEQGLPMLRASGLGPYYKR